MKKIICILCVFVCCIFAACQEESSIGVIGGADGPTAIFANEDGEDIMYQQITAHEAKNIMDNTENYIILDVREADEYAAGHIPGAVLLPYTEIEQKAENVLADKAQTILVYCRSGRRSKIAAESLAKLGYTDVKEFGGIQDWPYETEK